LEPPNWKVKKQNKKKLRKTNLNRNLNFLYFDDLRPSKNQTSFHPQPRHSRDICQRVSVSCLHFVHSNGECYLLFASIVTQTWLIEWLLSWAGKNGPFWRAFPYSEWYLWSPQLGEGQPGAA
jgi:hypothetical protein